MISGIVKARAAWVRLAVRGTASSEERIDAVIDTGYNGWLTLPAELITALKLPWKTVVTGTLADGSEAPFEVFEGQVIWDGKPRRVPIHEANAKPVIGMALLKGYELNIQVRSRGRVAIRQLKR
jgi:clan AA aspartic protease